MTADTIVSPYSDLDAAAAAIAQYGEGLACVIVEPVAGNMGVVPPAAASWRGLRALCDASGALLVFDEVITRFRLARGGAQERFGVLPDDDLQVVGSGLPLAAFRGRSDVMQELAPTGQVYQAGTLSGNPLATAAGLAVLHRLRDDSVYEELERRGPRLEAASRRTGDSREWAPWPRSSPRTPSATRRSSACSSRASTSAPSQFRGNVRVPLAHGDEEIERTVDAVAGFGG